MEENGEAPHTMQAGENVQEEASHDSQEVEASHKNAKGSKASPGRRGKRKLSATGSPVTSTKKPKNKEPATPSSDRPARERKSIDRFADSVEKEKERPKEIKIEQGSGMYLRDIPNVVFKLSKHKSSDELVQLLHRILYSKRVKPYLVKTNILQFSGFIWGPNEEKEKTKMKEKLEKIVKETLFQLSDLLDLSIARTTKKEDVVLRISEFLESPHKTTENLVQEQTQRQKKKKRGKIPTKGKRKRESSQTPQKRQRKEQSEEEKEEEALVEPEEEEPEKASTKKRAMKIKEPSQDAKSSSAKKATKRSSKSSALKEDAKEELIQESETELEEDDKKPTQKRRMNKKNDDVTASKSLKKASVKPVKTKAVHEPEETDLGDDAKNVKSKPLSKVSKKDVSKETKVPAVNLSEEKKKATTSSSKQSSKKKKKENNEDALEANLKKKMEASQSASKKEIEAPTIPPDEGLRSAICELLRDADFSTVTFTDVVKQLGAKFDVDLSQKKAHVKNLIQEEISKIVDEDDGDGAEDETGVNTPEGKEKEPIEAATED